MAMTKQKQLIIGIIITISLIICLVSEAETLEVVEKNVSSLWTIYFSIGFGVISIFVYIMFYIIQYSMGKVELPENENEDEFELQKEKRGTNQLQTLISYTNLQLKQNEVPFTFKKMAIYAFPAAILLIIGLYCYFTSLELTTPSASVTIYNSSCAFTYIFSLIILKEKFSISKLLAVILCIIGVVIISFGPSLIDLIEGNDDSNDEYSSIQESSKTDDDDEPKQTLQGDLVSLGAAIIFGFYYVILKKLFGDANITTVQFNLFLNGVYSIILLGPLIIILQYFDVITISISNFPQAASFFGGTFLGYIINLLVAFGIAIISPLYIAIATMLSVPATAVADYIIHDIKPTWMELIGTAILLLGFLLLNFDIDFKKLYHKITCKKIETENTDNDENLIDELYDNTIN